MLASVMRASSTETAGVVPTLQELVGLRHVAGTSQTARRGAFGHAGASASSVRGRGMEYAESREYVAGDDARHIDWKLTARTGRTQSKLFQAERERLTLLVADTAPVLFFGTRVRFKSVQAARVGAVAAWNALRNGDRVGIVRGSSSEPMFPPMGGTRGVLRVLDALARWYGQPPADDEGLVAALRRAARVARPGSRLIVLADPASAAAITTAMWTQLAAHHELLVLLMMDALELEPPKAVLPFRTNGGQVVLDTRSTVAAEQWRRAFSGPVAQLRDTLRGSRVQVQVVRSDDDSDAWLRALPKSRGR